MGDPTPVIDPLTVHFLHLLYVIRNTFSSFVNVAISRLADGHCKSHTELKKCDRLPPSSQAPNRAKRAALLMLTVSAHGQRHLICAGGTLRLAQSGATPTPAEGARAPRHTDTPGDRTEPQSRLTGENVDIQSSCPRLGETGDTALPAAG